MTDKATQERLEPCPFCGSAVSARYISHYFAGGEKKLRPLPWRVCCENDECAFEPCADFTTEAEAIAAWNRRSAPATRDAIIEECAKVARQFLKGDHALNDAAWSSGDPVFDVIKAINALKSPG